MKINNLHVAVLMLLMGMAVTIYAKTTQPNQQAPWPRTAQQQQLNHDKLCSLKATHSTVQHSTQVLQKPTQVATCSWYMHMRSVILSHWYGDYYCSGGGYGGGGGSGF